MLTTCAFILVVEKWYNWHTCDKRVELSVCNKQLIIRNILTLTSTSMIWWIQNSVQWVKFYVWKGWRAFIILTSFYIPSPNAIMFLGASSCIFSISNVSSHYLWSKQTTRKHLASLEIHGWWTMYYKKYMIYTPCTTCHANLFKSLTLSGNYTLV